MARYLQLFLVLIIFRVVSFEDAVVVYVSPRSNPPAVAYSLYGLSSSGWIEIGMVWHPSNDHWFVGLLPVDPADYPTDFEIRPSE